MEKRLVSYHQISVPHPAVSFALVLSCFGVYFLFFFFFRCVFSKNKGRLLQHRSVVIKPRKFSVDMILLSNQHYVF